MVSKLIHVLNHTYSHCDVYDTRRDQEKVIYPWARGLHYFSNSVYSSSSIIGLSLQACSVLKNESI